MKGATVISKEYTGSYKFPHDKYRQALMIVNGAGVTTVAFGGGDGKVPVEGILEPDVVPTSAMVIETTGTFVLVTDEGTHAEAEAVV